ncbi:HIT family protein [Lacticaseibacillus zhaodongensis]|uniref:HIT family protein n=1 Tax=Lacticaseibacillus zhaodongensis TaxID=2668065 RepID=UPI0012D33626|nr:HIT family protein [Lacticaseibacillus zhaodongensis]
MEQDCLICKRIAMIKDHKNPYFVKEMATGYVVLADSQYFPGYTLFLAKEHVTELHLMPEELKMQFLQEMSWVAEACSLAFHADKMNVEMLGNGDAHAHWHIIPRHIGDTPKPGPIWWVDPKIMYADATAPSAAKLTELKSQLQAALSEIEEKYNA